MEEIQSYQLQQLSQTEQKICLALLRIKQCQNADTIRKLLEWFERIENLDTLEQICMKVNMSLFTQYLYFNFPEVRQELTSAMMSIIKHMINCGGENFVKQFVVIENGFIEQAISILNDATMMEFHSDIIQIISRFVPYAPSADYFGQLIEPLVLQLYPSNPLVKQVLVILQILLVSNNTKYQILFAKYEGIPSLVEIIDDSDDNDSKSIAIQILKNLIKSPMENARMAFNKRIFNTRILDTFITIINFQDSEFIEQILNLLDLFCSIPQNLETIYRSEIFHCMLPMLDTPKDDVSDKNIAEAIVHSLLQVTMIKEAAISLSNVGLPMKIIQIIEDFNHHTSKTLEYVCSMIMNMCNFHDCKKQFINFKLSETLKKVIDDDEIDEFLKGDLIDVKKRFDGMKMREEMFLTMQSAAKKDLKQQKKIQNAQNCLQILKEEPREDEIEENEIYGNGVGVDEMDDLYAGLDDLDVGNGLTNISLDELNDKRDKEVKRMKDEEERKRKEEIEKATSFKINIGLLNDTDKQSSTNDVSLQTDSDKQISSEEGSMRSSQLTPRRSTVKDYIGLQKNQDPSTKFSTRTHNPTTNRHAFLSHQRQQEGNLKKSLRYSGPDGEHGQEMKKQKAQNIMELLDVPTMNELTDPQSNGFSTDDAKLIADLNVKKVTRRHIVQEMYQTEKTYSEQLGKVCTVVMPEMKKVMTEEDYQKLFNNIESVYSLHKEFFLNIETVWKTEQDKPLILVADLFLDLFSDKNMYETYMYYYTHADSGLHFNYSKCSPTVQQLSMKFKQQRMPIESFLIQPIQRLPRYILLLKELIKSTPPIAEPEYSKLNKARELCDKITCDFNAATKIIRDKQHLLEYSQKIDGYVAAKDRKFVRDGEIITKTKKRKLVASVCLMSDVLFLLQKKKERFTIVQELPFKSVTGVLFKEPKKKTSLEKIIHVEYMTSKNREVIEFIMGVEIPFQEWFDDLKKCLSLVE